MLEKVHNLFSLPAVHETTIYHHLYKSLKLIIIAKRFYRKRISLILNKWNKITKSEKKIGTTKDIIILVTTHYSVDVLLKHLKES
jgi:hypothetical protein